MRHGLIEKVFHQIEIFIFTKKRLSAAAPASYIFFKKINKLISVIFIWEMYVSTFTWLLAIALSAATSSSLVITTRRWDTAGGRKEEGLKSKKNTKSLSQKNNSQTECIFFEVVTLCRKFTFYNIAKKLPIVLSILCLLDLLIVF